jgi:hypothetical protein
VWTRSEYCNTPHPASDPLNGTDFGDKLEKAAKTKPSDGLDMRLSVAVFADESNAGRVYVATSFRGESLQHEVRNGTLYATIGSLVLVYREDGTLSTRYSDFACCDYGKQSNDAQNEIHAPPAGEVRVHLPNRYETQFSLSPGKYVIRAVISDGTHFGIRESPLTVEGRDPEKLSVAGVVIVRRVRRFTQNTTEGAERVADSYRPLVSKEVEFTPTANTDFFEGDTLFSYFEICSPVVPGHSGTKVFANIRILDSKSGSVADTFEPVDIATYNIGNSVISVGRGVVLNHLLPGNYQLQVQASNADGQKTEWRSASFTVLAARPLELRDGLSQSKKEIILPTTPESDYLPSSDSTDLGGFAVNREFAALQGKSDLLLLTITQVSHR